MVNDEEYNKRIIRMDKTNMAAWSGPPVHVKQQKMEKRSGSKHYTLLTNCFKP